MTTDWNSVLKSHPLEDIKTIRSVEKLLTTKRNYVSKIPPNGSNVIHLVSGGIDSITTWAMLLHTYKLRVHPVCVDTGQKRHEQELTSVRYFSALFKKRFPKQYVDPFYMTFPMSAPEISVALRGNLDKNIHKQVLADNFDMETNTVTLTRSYLFPAFFPYPAALAAFFFELQRNVKIRTIFCSILPTDGLYNASQTLTAIRAAGLSLCAFTHDYSWQVISLCFDNNLNVLQNKSDIIRWAARHHIPIEHAYTCLKGTDTHCGNCIACGVRKEAFKQADVVDMTHYSNDSSRLSIKSVLAMKCLVTPIKRLYQPFVSRIRSMKFMKRIVIKDYY
jgi:7-cyano-7-deazaguanine synthase in queuosine biosynthesis